MEKWPIGVFTSIGAGLGAGLDAVKEVGATTVQLHTPPKNMRTPEKIAEIKKQFEDAGITVTVVFCGFEGESYADIPTVKETVGLVPKATRAERLAEAKAVSDFAKAMGVEATALHLGFIPEDESHPDYEEIVRVTQELADYCAANGQRLHLETGQETADGLLKFIGNVDRANLAVNFDPANMILYGSGEPIPALKKVGKYVKSVHCKDAKWSANPGKEWGVETPLGEGDVNIELFLSTLKEIGYFGPLTIEREISGEQQKKDIAAAVQLLKELRAKLL